MQLMQTPCDLSNYKLKNFLTFFYSNFRKTQQLYIDYSYNDKIASLLSCIFKKEKQERPTWVLQLKSSLKLELDTLL